MNPALPPGWLLHAHESLASTNEEALRLASDGAAEGTVVQARRQQAGRGRHGRRWISEEGNLYCTTVIRPRCPPAQAAAVGFVAAVAASEAIDRAAGEGRRTAIKWPNDILLEGRKIAGILIEADTDGDGSVAAMVIGIGVNVAHAPELPGYPTASLRQCGGALGVDADAVLEYLCAALHDGLRRWRSEGFGIIRDQWLARCAGLGGPLTVKTPAGTLGGRFVGLDEDGALLLETGGGVRRIVAGDVLLGVV